MFGISGSEAVVLVVVVGLPIAVVAGLLLVGFRLGRSSAARQTGRTR